MWTAKSFSKLGYPTKVRWLSTEPESLANTCTCAQNTSGAVHLGTLAGTFDFHFVQVFSRMWHSPHSWHISPLLGWNNVVNRVGVRLHMWWSCVISNWAKTKEAEGEPDNIWEWNLCRNSENGAAVITVVAFPAEQTWHTHTLDHTSHHHKSTSCLRKMHGALRYAALPQSCLACSWTSDVTERERESSWRRRRLEKSVCPQLSARSVCLAASQSPELSTL